MTMESDPHTTAIFPPHPKISQGSRVGDLETYREMYEASISDPKSFWRQQAERLSWFESPQRICKSDMKTAEFEWYGGGKLNACHNCVTRHLPQRANQTAIIWARDEAGEYEHISYQQLEHEVCRTANVLISMGVRSGDRVCIYLPMIPQLAYVMLACARIGAIHSIVFAGFSAQSLRDRILDAQCKVVVTANEGLRGGKKIPLKATVDEAIAELDIVERVLVVRRTELEVAMKTGRDFDYSDECSKQKSVAPTEWMDSESPLFILYTSGSTGKPKGLLHTTAGYLTYVSLTHEYLFDLKPDDIYMCAADIGWVTGHSYIIYGPLANGTTTVMFESTPLYPNAERYWQVIQDLKVNIFYTAPTAIRAVARMTDKNIDRYDRSSLRVLGTVGEPINPEIWRWYHEVVGQGRCAVVDTWWQTETGGMMIAPFPGATPCKPGAATLPFFGVKPCLFSENGELLEGNDVRGRLCIELPWPGQARTIWGDHERFVKTYFSDYPGYYFTGDGCWRDSDGYLWITGRVDDVLNVSGHRLGTAEIESALVAHKKVAEAAVVGIPHDIKGTSIYAYVILNRGYDESNGPSLVNPSLVQELKQCVREVIGAIAVPEVILPIPGLPKTRSGKIMRRVLRKVAHGEYRELGDITTLADPEIVEQIIKAHQASS